MDDAPGWCRNFLAAAGVLPGERVRIVVDEPFRAEGETLAAAASAAGATARVVCFPAERPLRAPTHELLESAAWADVSLGLLHDTFAEELLARREMLDLLLAHGGRAVSCDTVDHETLLGELSQPMRKQPRSARESCSRLLDGARELHLRGRRRHRPRAACRRAPLGRRLPAARARRRRELPRRRDLHRAARHRRETASSSPI